MQLRNQRWKILTLLVIMICSACAQQTNQAEESSILMLDLSNVNIDTSLLDPTASPTFTTEPTGTNLPSPTVAASDNNDSAASATPAPQTAVNTPTPICTNQAEFVKHLNVSYNTEFKPSTSFAKVWLIKNTGTCTWSTEYKLIYVDGDLMGGPNEIFLHQEVVPGETIDIRVNLLAPVKPSTYANLWMLQDDLGSNFGIGPSGDDPLKVQIVVVSPYKAPRL